MAGSLLNEMLRQGERIQMLLTQSSERLASVDVDSAHDLLHQSNETVKSHLQEATRCLATLQETLRNEIRDRTLVDHQLAAAVEQQEGARNASLHDPLTGLPNRVLFMDRLDHGIAQSVRNRWILAVMFVDLDDFKSINDTYGHLAGDAVLQTVATRLKHCARADDTVSRYGGDEFLCLLMPLHEAKDVEMIAAKMMSSIREPCAVQAGEVSVRLSLGASIGVALFPQDGTSPATLIRRADEAMYRAKQVESRFGFAP